MDTKMFFSMLMVLLLIGVFANLITGNSMPSLPNYVPQNITAQDPGYCSTCTDPGLLGLNCIGGALMCFGYGVVMFLYFIFSIIVGLATFLGAMIAFFSGISVFLGYGGIIAIPEPLNFMLAVLVFFAWMFLLIEAVRRFKAVVFPS